MKNDSIQPKKAVSLFLETWQAPVVTDYDLGVFVYRLFQRKEYQGHRVEVANPNADGKDFRALIEQCLEDGILNKNRDFPFNTVFNILGKARASADEIVCAVNPFAFVSHLSAMDYHSLTDRNPATLFISAPSAKTWKTHATERMEKDLGDELPGYLGDGFPPLKRKPLIKINKRSINLFASSHRGAYRNVRGRTLRVATIGRTFLDMLRAPNLCGGMEHVLDVYTEHARGYLDLIVSEIDRIGKPIDKVRAGCILEEFCGLDHETFTTWEAFTQRGGSRKLDPSEEFASEYSKKWRLSLNTIKKPASKDD